jgi:hypothetical protein
LHDNIASYMYEVNSLQKYKLFLIGIGFFWIFSWCIFGSILGAQVKLLNSTAVTPSEFMIWQRTLLRSAHAHMNSMGITTILIGLSIPHIKNMISEKKIKIIILTNLVSIPIFGFGIILEAFFPDIIGKISLISAISAIGGIFYILTMAIWSSLFIFSAMKKNG